MRQRILFFSYGIVTSAMLFLLHLDVRSYGFPDGHKTTFERAAEKPFLFWIAANSVLMVFFILNFPGVRIQKITWRVHLIIALTHILVCFIGYRLIYYYYRIHLGLEDGEGG